jgi:tetratricopeptide (TPR) repeat protein
MHERTASKKQSRKKASQRRAWATTAKIALAVAFVFVALNFNLAKMLRQLGENLTERKVPDLKTAQQYYDKGAVFKNKGWVEPSRQCLQRAIAMDRGGPVGKKAEIYLRTRLPLKPVSYEAEQESIEAYNLSAEGKYEQANAVWKRLIKQAPDFEWPLTNLAWNYVDMDELDEAELLARHVLDVNPHFANAKLVMSALAEKRKDFETAKQWVDKVLKEDPENYEALAARQQIERAEKCFR